MSLSDVIKSMEDRFSFKKKATVGGISFEISLLNYEQDRNINSIPDEGDDPLSFYEKTRTQLLSYAITSIDGETIPESVEVIEEGKTVTKEKSIYVKDILKKLPQKIVEKIFEIYVDFKEETDKKLDEDVEYKWYKTPEERKKEREKKEKEEEPEEESTPEESSNEKDLDERPISFTKIEEKEENPDESK